MIFRAAVTGLKWASIAKVACQSVTWIITLLVMRLLDPTDYGVAAVAAVFVGLLAALAELGLGAALIQAREVNETEASRVAAASILLNTTCALAIAALSPALSWFYNDPLIGYIATASALSLVFSSFATVPESLLYRDMSFRRLALADVSSAVIGSVATLSLALAGYGVWSLVMGPLTGSLSRTVLVVSLSRWIRPRFSLRGLGGHLRFGGTLTASRLAWQASQQSDVLIGGHFLSEAALGVYSVSVHLARMPLSKVMSVINQVAFPTVARMQSDRASLATHAVEAIWLLSFLSIPVLWGLSSVSGELIYLLLGDSWKEARAPLQIAALVMPAQLLANVMSTILTGLGRTDIELRNMLTTLALTLVAVLAGAQFGVIGLTAGWSAAALAGLAVTAPRASRIVGLDLSSVVAAVRAPLLAGVCMYAAVIGAGHLLDDAGSLVRLGVKISVGAAVYLCMVSMLSPGIWPIARRVMAAVRSA